MASITKEVNLRLAKRPLKTDEHLPNRGLTSLVKEATGDLIFRQANSSQKCSNHWIQNLTVLLLMTWWVMTQKVRASAKIVPLLIYSVVLPRHSGSTPERLYPTIHHSEQKCPHFCSEWWIAGYETVTLLDLWDCSIPLEVFCWNPEADKKMFHGYFNQGTNSWQCINLYY